MTKAHNTIRCEDGVACVGSCCYSCSTDRLCKCHRAADCQSQTAQHAEHNPGDTHGDRHRYSSHNGRDRLADCTGYTNCNATSADRNGSTNRDGNIGRNADRPATNADATPGDQRADRAATDRDHYPASADHADRDRTGGCPR